MSYSQRDEESHILNHFKNQSNGVFLDIGAYHPTVFSNTRALVERGWKGVYVDPATDLIQKFHEEYVGKMAKNEIQLFCLAVGDRNDNVTYYNSGGDAVGSCDKAHADKWERGYDVKFKKETVQMVRVEALLNRAMFDTFDFVNIDIEGLDFVVLSQFNFDQIGTKCVCVEYNGQNKQDYINYMNGYGFVVIYESPENLIFVR